MCPRLPWPSGVPWLLLRQPSREFVDLNLFGSTTPLELTLGSPETQRTPVQSALIIRDSISAPSGYRFESEDTHVPLLIKGTILCSLVSAQTESCPEARDRRGQCWGGAPALGPDGWVWIPALAPVSGVAWGKFSSL